MSGEFDRTKLILGSQGVDSLSSKKVIIFGIGGVGGYVAEALARSGLGQIDIVDKDTVDITNINRQIIALHSTIGMPKVEVMKKRMLDINPDIIVNAYECFFLPENSHEFNFSQYDYIVDAVDTVTAKIEIITLAKACNVPVISAMGAGNKLDATAFKVADISKTKVCPLAKVMRRELKNRGIKDVKVVYSEEEAIKPTNSCNVDLEDASDRSGLLQEDSKVLKKSVPGSIAFVPSVMGLIMAGEVIKDLSGISM